MQRLPLLVPIVSGMLGLALARTDMVSIDLALLLSAIFTITLLLFRQRLPAVIFMLGLALGIADLLRDASQMSVDESWITGDIVISAEIERVEQLPSYHRYLLHHISREDGTRLSGKALVYDHGRHHNKQIQTLQAGQSIQARVRWREPRNYQNPGSFDYRTWCFDRHISLIGSLKGNVTIINATVPWLEQARQRVRSAIASVSTGESGVLQAVLLGDRSQVSAAANNAFSATGTAHLLAISGMHVGMAAAWVFVLAWFVLTRREAWIVRVPVRNLALLCACLGAGIYAVLAGWPLPAIRAVLMLAAAALAWCLATRAEPLNTLLAALGLILLFDPSAIASLSLWLSFIATAALLMWAGKPGQIENPSISQRLQAAIKALIWISLLAALATLPLIIATFGRIPVYSLPANLVMVPLYALIVMPAGLLAEVLALIGLETLAGALMQLSGMAIEAGLNILISISEWPAGQLWATQPPLWLGLLYMAGMLLSGWLLFTNKRLKAAVFSALILTGYLGFVLTESDISAPQWIVWDVGQGAASTLLLPNKQVIVVDAPGRAGSRFNGGTTVAAGLRHLGLTHVDILILSHAQSDHLGGALSLLQQLNWVGQIWLPDVPAARNHKRVKAIMAYAQQHGISIRWLARGDQIDLDLGLGLGLGLTDDKQTSVALKVLWPPRAFDPSNTNNTSLVFSVQMPNQLRLLWPGDIEVVAEKVLISAGLEKVDMMLIPHHGSRSSSHAAFVQAVSPSLVIAQTGYGNHYGFPKDDVVARYQEIGADIYNTAHGALLLHWPNDDSSASVEVQQGQQEMPTRRELARHWHKAL